MNKELEENIGRLKKDLNECKNDTTTLVFTEDLETLLNYIDNSIPKEVIEKKIEEYKEKIEEAIEEDDDVKEIYYEQEIEILQELLEAK